MNIEKNTGGEPKQSTAHVAAVPQQRQADYRPDGASEGLRPRRPSWNVEVPSAETAAIAIIGLAEAANLAGYVDGAVAGGAVAVTMAGFLVKKCIRRNP